ncbi:MAG TPA: DUF47 family protein [Verrucomicrobiae bacterium]|nr:DUF47 family protein [Verrucomicrobiae bacterium]
MIGFRRFLGREDRFFSLLEASAQEGMHAILALKRILTHPEGQASLDEFVEARRKDKEVTTALEEMLITTFVTPLEREDLEALAETLYKIPKTVEKFAERYLVAQPQIAGCDFSRQLALSEQAVHLVLQMMQALHARELGDVKDLQARLQAVESEADDILLEDLRKLYQPGVPSLRAVILKELFDLLEKVIDRCRDTGNVIAHVLLKNA